MGLLTKAQAVSLRFRAAVPTVPIFSICLSHRVGAQALPPLRDERRRVMLGSFAAGVAAGALEAALAARRAVEGAGALELRTGRAAAMLLGARCPVRRVYCCDGVCLRVLMPCSAMYALTTSSCDT